MTELPEVDTTKLIRHQMQLERLYNKNQTIPRIRKEFMDCEAVNFQEYIQSKNIPLMFGIDLLVQMALHKRANLPTLVGVMRRHTNSVQECTDLLLRCAEVDLVDWSPAWGVFIVKFSISEDVQLELDKYQYPLPMVVEPRKIENNRDTGYIMSRGSIILRDNHHEDDVCLDHINRMNSIAFVINNDTATMVKNKWRNLDKPKDGETKADFQRRVRAFNKYDRTAHDVINEINRHGNQFYLTHKYDKRGRVYCQGYHVNYQGAAWNKAVIEFAEGEVVE